MKPVMMVRLALGATGVALISYGAVRLLANSRETNPLGLGRWLAGAVIVHDGIFVPIVSLLGVVLAKLVKPRPRRYLQGSLIVAGALTLIAIPEIHLQGIHDPAKAWLRQDYTRNLHILWMIVAAAGLLCYLTSVVYGYYGRKRRHTNDLP